MSTEDTILTLVGIGLPLYSARGLTQTLVPIEQSGAPRRTINGDLVETAGVQFRKYRSSITGSDQRPPAFDGIWAGTQIEVDCIVALAYPEYGPAQRPVVTGSHFQESGYNFYRPRLQMTVIAFTLETDEWGAVVSWTLELEET